MDGSGGRGRPTENWEFPRLGKPIGMAGGMANPQDDYRNLRIAMAAAQAAQIENAWVDAEQHLRTTRDEFSIELAERFVERVERLNKSQLSLPKEVAKNLSSRRKQPKD